MKNLQYVLSVLLIFFFVSCTSDADKKKAVYDLLGKEIDSLSFEDTKKIVLGSYAQFSMFYNFLESFGGDDKPRKYEIEDEKYGLSFELPALYEEIDFKNGIKFSQSLDYPKSVLKIDSETKEDNGSRITYFIDRIYYEDNTSDSIDTSISSSYSTDMKRIDSVKITIRYRYTLGFDELELSKKEKKINYKGGTVSLKDKENNYIQYVMSDTISGLFITGQAVNASGKILDRSGYSSGNLPPDKQRKKYKDGFKALEKIAQKIKDDKYKTKEDLVLDLYDKISGLGITAAPGAYYRSEYYYGNVDKLLLYFSKEKITKEYTFTFPVVSTIDAYNLIWDEQKQKHLIVDHSGETIVESDKKGLQQINGYYYQLLDYYNDLILHLDVDKKRLEVLKPYKSSNVSFLSNDLVLLKYRSKQGVLGKDGSFLIPVVYDNITFNDENKTIIASNVGSFNLFDISGNSFFSGKGSLGQFSEGLAIYKNNEGKNIAFIDGHGKIAISISQYDQIEPFTENLAVAEKNGKFGCVRRDGSVAIPFVYDEIKEFSYGVTLVKVGDEYGLINTDNEFILPLDKTGGYSMSTNFGKRSYSINGKTYNEKGQLTKEEDN